MRREQALGEGMREMRRGVPAMRPRVGPGAHDVP